MHINLCNLKCCNDTMCTEDCQVYKLMLGSLKFVRQLLAKYYVHLRWGATITIQNFISLN